MMQGAVTVGGYVVVAGWLRRVVRVPGGPTPFGRVVWVEKGTKL